ncbi:hypothetical protein SAMN02910456_02075 [Ruminococcaceae bacterium YRB3002]|nr:hypothetical protein SAMN02910456_02075 [Ruminococcaceae bacterium YRB3002]
MSKSNYDEAYESESKRYPAIFRMTDTNKKAIIIFIAVYVLANVAIALLVGLASVPLMLYMFMSIAINIAITAFVINALLGNMSNYLQGVATVAIPIWTVAILLVPGLRTIPNIAFIIPLAWIETMMVVETRIHTAAQRRANNLDALEREHNLREQSNAYQRAAAGVDSESGNVSEADYGPLKGRDGRFCPVCGIELGPDDTECPMCGPQE